MHGISVDADGSVLLACRFAGSDGYWLKVQIDGRIPLIDRSWLGNWDAIPARRLGKSLVNAPVAVFAESSEVALVFEEDGTIVRWKDTERRLELLDLEGRFARVGGVARGPRGEFVVSDIGGHAVYRVDAVKAQLTRIAGTGIDGHEGDGGPAIHARFAEPAGLAVGANGDVFVADRLNHRVRRIGIDGSVDTVVGTGARGRLGDGGPPRRAALDSPSAVAIASDAALLIADRGNRCVRRVDAAGITTLAGLEDLDPTAIAALADGRVLIADAATRRVLVWREGAPVGVFAGDGRAGAVGDGATPEIAYFKGLTSIVTDASGRIYVSDALSHRVRRIDPGGSVSTVAGDGFAAFTKDGIEGRRSSLNGPTSLAWLPDGSLLIAESGSHRIRRLAPDQTLHTFAGNGQPGSDGDGGPASAATFFSPDRIASDARGNVYVGDSGRLRRIDGRTGRIATIVEMGEILGLAVTPAGDVFALERDRRTQDCRLRRVDVRRRSSSAVGPVALPFRAGGVSVSADGALVYLAGYNEGVRALSPRNGTLTTLVDTNASVAAEGTQFGVMPLFAAALAPLPGGGLLVAGGVAVYHRSPGGTLRHVAGGGAGF